MSVAYWGPIDIRCYGLPSICILFSGSSSYAKSDKAKLDLFYSYVIALYIIALTMFVQRFNAFEWTLITYLPNYVEFVTDFLLFGSTSI